MNYRGTLTGLLVMTLGVAAVSADAEPQGAFESGWYLGGGLSFNDVYIYDDVCWGCYGNAEYGEGDSSGTLTLGFRASRYLAIEGSYIGTSTLGWGGNVLLFQDFFDPYTVDADVDLASYQVSVLGIAAGRYWEAYLRLGLALWDAHSDLTRTLLTTGNVVPESLDRNGNDFVFGIGGGRAFGDGWQIRLDYAFFPIDDALLGLDNQFEAYSDYTTLQLIKRFGAN